MKRIFTDVDIYEDEWYQDLSKEHKLFWDYICRRAEYGIWKPNFKLAEFQLQIKVDPKEALKAFNSENGEVKKRIIITHDNRWFIPSWIEFQYPTLSEDCPAHKPLFKFYQGQYGYLFDSYLVAIPTLQEKEEDMEKEKGMEKEKEKDAFRDDGCGKKGNFHPLAKLWNDVCLKQPRVREISSSRLAKCQRRLSDRSLENWRLVFEKINASAFCNGDSKTGWRATFDWIIANDENAVRVLEGKYDGRKALVSATTSQNMATLKDWAEEKS